MSHDSVQQALATLRSDGFWDNIETRRKLLAKVPEYRLSKFQRALPDQYEVEMIGAYLLDFEGVGRWIQGN